MKATQKALIPIVLTLVGCAQQPSDKEIQGAAVEYLIGQDYVNMLQAVRVAHPDLDISKVEAPYPTNAKVLTYHSAGCAKSQVSDGYVCTISIAVTFDRAKSELWSPLGLRKVDGSFLFHLDSSKNFDHSTDGWELIELDNAR